MSRLRQFFDKTYPTIIGMIHVGSLPGTPKSKNSISAIIDQACKEAEIYKSCNIGAVLLENMHDIPYIQSDSMGPEITASMTRVCNEVRRLLPESVHCGVQVLAGANKEALAIAMASNLQFIRVEGYVFSHIGDEGMMNSCAGNLLRYRKSIGADHVFVFTDIKKKHSAHSITADVSLEETAKAAEFFLSDGVILTGCATGDPASAEELKTIKKVCSIPVLIGSGVTIDNINDYTAADAIIIGSHFKKHGRWENELDEDRVINLLNTVNQKKKEAQHNTG